MRVLNISISLFTSAAFFCSGCSVANIFSDSGTILDDAPDGGRLSGDDAGPGGLNDAGRLLSDGGSMIVDSGNVALDGGASFPDSGQIFDAGSFGVYLPLSETTCEELCEQRAEDIEGTGSCPFEWNSGDCPSVCDDEFSLFEQETQLAFVQCTLWDPLCYQDIEGCVWAARYPGPVSFPVTFSGTGFNEHEGHTIRIAAHTAADVYHFAPDTPITNGAVEVTWTIHSTPSHGVLFMYYIDVNNDSICTSGDGGVDYAGSRRGDFGPDFDHPEVSGAETYDADTHEWVCDYL